MNDKMAFWGHRADDGRVQPLIEHLRGVSELAGRFADAFGESGMGKLVGLYHDIRNISSAKYAMRRAGINCSPHCADELIIKKQYFNPRCQAATYSIVSEFEGKKYYLDKSFRNDII